MAKKKKPQLFSPFARLRRQTAKRLHVYTRPSINFFVLISLSAAIVSLGLLLDNASIVIGGMVVAPLITPIFGFSLHLILFHPKGMMRPLQSIFLGTIFAVVTAMIVGYIGLFIEGESVMIGQEILSRANSNLLFFLVALLSGMAGAYAYAKPEVLSSITGIAISVALVPPLAVTGLGFALGDVSLASESFVLYMFNLAGICFGSIMMFLILGFGKDL